LEAKLELQFLVVSFNNYTQFSLVGVSPSLVTACTSVLHCVAVRRDGC